MEEAKKWFESKLVWLGVIQTLIAVLQLAAEFLAKGSFDPSAIALFVGGIFTIILRIWFTDKPVQ